MSRSPSASTSSTPSRRTETCVEVRKPHQLAPGKNLVTSAPVPYLRRASTREAIEASSSALAVAAQGPASQGPASESSEGPAHAGATALSGLALASSRTSWLSEYARSLKNTSAARHRHRALLVVRSGSANGLSRDACFHARLSCRPRVDGASSRATVLAKTTPDSRSLEKAIASQARRAPWAISVGVRSRCRWRRATELWLVAGRW